jgi:hypothetical protein
MEKMDDPRAREALDVLLSLRQDDGCWRCRGSWWRPSQRDGASNVEVVDWAARGPSPMLTLNALRILRAAGRLG